MPILQLENGECCCLCGGNPTGREGDQSALDSWLYEQQKHHRQQEGKRSTLSMVLDEGLLDREAGDEKTEP